MREPQSVRRRRVSPDLVPPGEQLRRHLRPGEKLRWSARPDPRIYAASKAQPGYYGLLMVVLWIIWLIIALFEEPRPDHSKLQAIAFSLPFLLPGLWLMAIPLRHGLYSRSMAYGITDRRLLIAAEMPKPSLLSFAPKDIKSVQRFDYENGLSSILFAYMVTGQRRAWQRRLKISPIGFFGIEGAAEVEEMVKTLSRLRVPED